MKTKPYHLLFGSFFAMTAVMLGAFGAHGLKEVLSPEQLSSFQTGVRYQMFHALAILMIAMKGHHYHLKNEAVITTLFGIGILLFSFSIYALNLQDLIGMNLKWLGPITPLGGSMLILGWLMIFLNAVMLIFTKKS